MQLPFGKYVFYGLTFHPFSLIYFVFGCLQISQTLRIPKPWQNYNIWSFDCVNFDLWPPLAFIYFFDCDSVTMKSMVINLFTIIKSSKLTQHHHKLFFSSASALRFKPSAKLLQVDLKASEVLTEKNEYLNAADSIPTPNIRSMKDFHLKGMQFDIAGNISTTPAHCK